MNKTRGTKLLTQRFSDRNFFAGFRGSIEAKRPLLENLILAFWLMIVIGSMLTHELWRDEVRSLDLVTDIHTLTEFFSMAKYDGHPVLWRSILTLLHTFVPHSVVLPLASLVIGFVTVWMFIKFSPFPLWFSTLFIFVIVPMGTNSVSCRDYGITMLLFFLFAFLVTSRVKRPITTGVILFLAANTNSYGMYMSGLLLGYWIVESGIAVFKDSRYVSAVFITFTGILVAYLSMRGDIDTLFPPPDYMSHIDYGKNILQAFIHPGQYIAYILNADLAYRDIFMTVLIIGLAAVRPVLGLTLFVAVVFFNFVGGALIYPQTRHQGVLLGFIMTTYWISYTNIVRESCKYSSVNLNGTNSATLQRQEFSPCIQNISAEILPSGSFVSRITLFLSANLVKKRNVVFFVALYFFGVPFLIHNVVLAKNGILEEARVEKSSALALGEYIRSNAQLSKSIIIGEPDYKMQTIAYYVHNRIYLVREKRFRKFVKYSSEYKKPLQLSSLLHSARALWSQYHVPILIVLGYFGFSEDKAHVFNAMYRGTFIMSAESIRNFKNDTIKLAEFNGSLGDENYQLFMYAPAENLKRYTQKYMELR